MASTLRLYIDASYAVTVMAIVGIISGFATAAATGDTERSVQAALAMFGLTGVILAIRLWRVTRKTSTSVETIVPKEPLYL
jgi:hypothetical protein